MFEFPLSFNIKSLLPNYQLPTYMSLLRANFPGSGDFAPFFRLLSDYYDHRSARNQPEVRSFSPRFDIRESEDARPLPLFPRRSSFSEEQFLHADTGATILLSMVLDET